jgi:hypothetical protein
MGRLTPITVVLLLLLSSTLYSQKKEPAINLQYEKNIGLSYEDAIDAYSQLDSCYPQAILKEMGMTDAGRPLHLFMISENCIFDPAQIKKEGKCIILINNGIHPGEPEGIDASVKFACDILANKNGMKKYLKNCVIAIIPVYNIGGLIDHSRYFRIDQNGPEEKGVRRNPRFLDLNRDFVKQESREARSFAEICQYLDPDVFLDTHTTDGSDHQFTLTLIATQAENMTPDMGRFFKNEMIPALYKRMKEESNCEMVPYVEYSDHGPVNSILGFEECPYFSTGYTALFNTLSFMTETLVYKPFPERVEATYKFISQLVRYTSENNSEIIHLRTEANKTVKETKEYVIAWKTDTTRWDYLLFKGYQWNDTLSPISNRTTGYYNHNRPYTDTIKYFDYFEPLITIKAPKAYIVPFAWEEVIERMQHNGVQMYQLKSDTTLNVETYYIDSYEPVKRATQGHYINTNVKLHTVGQDILYHAGDYVIPVNQRANKYIVYMLEPQTDAGFFTWNFFDSFLEGQDWYSVWGFESHIKSLLDNDNTLRAGFEEQKKLDKNFEYDHVAQLQWLYQRTPEYGLEKRRMLYPVGRIVERQK